jgi:hypothetical protein
MELSGQLHALAALPQGKAPSSDCIGLRPNVVLNPREKKKKKTNPPPPPGIKPCFLDSPELLFLVACLSYAASDRRLREME